MKKNILTVVAVLGFVLANAQEVKFGIKAGLNLANVSGDIEDNSSRIGYQIGAFAEIKISDQFRIQPELLYSAQGANSKEKAVDYSYEEKVNFDYIAIPVIGKVYLNQKFNIELGPQIGFLTSAKIKFKENDGGDTTSGTGNIKSLFKSTDFSINFGLGCDVTEKVSIGARYNLGISNIVNEKKIEVTDYSLKNNVFTFSVGYKL